MDEGVSVRAGTVKDLPFIINSWLVSYRKSLWSRFIRDSIYFDNHKLILANILDTAKVDVMHANESEDDIVGYIVYHPQHQAVNLHYVYIKQIYRDLGFASRLIRNAVGSSPHRFCTHATDAFPAFRDRFKISYDPYLLFNYVRGL